jgi:hypothetical protein
MLKGDTIKLLWNVAIPPQQQFLVLKVEKAKIEKTFGKIRAKEAAKVSIKSKDEFMKEYIIYLANGTLGGGDSREGIQAIPAIRSEYKSAIVREPSINCIRYYIPITEFKRMIGSFTKVKKSLITVQIYYANTPEFGKQGVGFSISDSIGPDGSSSSTYEKYGELYEDPNEAEPIIHPQTQLRIVGVPQNSTSSSATQSSTSSSGSGSSSASGGAPIVRKPTQFVFSADKIPILLKFASIHKEGNVIIQYERGCHLCIAGEMGSFGSFRLYLYNEYVQSIAPAITYPQRTSSSSTTQQTTQQTAPQLMSPPPLTAISATTSAATSSTTTN